ncbi:Fic family protein [Candidatus Daviesbacteria bacterium]|nr:Fic family protein [Candidatus Daviesbacteria bacterium]
MGFKPKYTISPEVLGAISEIAEIKGIIERSPVLPLNELELKRQALIRMVHTSTSIEGNKLEEYQVDKVLSGMSVSADDQSIAEVKNYQAALKEVEKMAKNNIGITVDVILKIHALTMSGLLENHKSGNFRPGDVYIVDDLGNGKEHLRFKGPPTDNIKPLIRELLLWLKHSEKDQLHPVIKAGIFHSQFVHIHPFSDGNGRVTRLLTNLLLYLDGWDFRKVIVLEAFYNKNRQDYYNALAYGWNDFYKEGADFTSWLEYFIAGFLVEARKVKNVIVSLGFDKVGDRTQTYLDPDELKIMDFLVSNQKITSGEVTKLVKVAKRTAQLKLKNLLDKKLIKSEGKARATFYVLIKD